MAKSSPVDKGIKEKSSKASGVPAVLVRGLAHFVSAEDGPGAAALRSASKARPASFT